MGGEFYAEPFINLTDSGQDETNSGEDETNSGLDPSAIGGTSFIDPRKVSYIPLWQTVYHDYMLTYSMVSFIDGHDAPFYRRGLGQPLVWGEIPQIWGEASNGTGYPAQAIAFDPNLYRYVQRIAALRTTFGYPFVVTGACCVPLHRLCRRTRCRRPHGYRIR